MATQEQNARFISGRLSKAVREFGLIDEGDRVLIALSGGKDSLCLTEFLARRARIRRPRFSVEALHVRMENVDYESDTRWMTSFCERQGVRLHVVSTRFEPDRNARRTPCFLCSWTRRKQLFAFAQAGGFQKIALGHHMDDLLHTLLLNEMYGGRFATMPARLTMRKMPLTLIRPLCSTPENAIREYALQAGYQPQLKRCPFEHDSQRDRIRTLFADMEQQAPGLRASLWHALLTDHKLTED